MLTLLGFFVKKGKGMAEKGHSTQIRYDEL
jgi:hypothetical protein